MSYRTELRIKAEAGDKVAQEKLDRLREKDRIGKRKKRNKEKKQTKQTKRTVSYISSLQDKANKGDKVAKEKLGKLWLTNAMSLLNYTNLNDLDKIERAIETRRRKLLVEKNVEHHE